MRCKACGKEAGPERWRTLCRVCFREQKRRDEAEMEARVAVLEEENAQLRMALRRMAVASGSAAAFGRLPPERLRQLIQLCHPDKHGQSKLSVEVTQWLNEQKGR